MPRHHATKPDGGMEVATNFSYNLEARILAASRLAKRLDVLHSLSERDDFLRMSKVALSLDSHFTGFATTDQLLKTGICVLSYVAIGQ